MTTLTIAKTPAELRQAVTGWRDAGHSIALVPTMGALHAGHDALFIRAGAEAQRVVASIFVNPAQFGPHEDLGRYPRSEAEDLERLRAAGADLAYMPGVEDVYPAGFATTVVPAGPALAGLEDKVRPEHFRGVATVVAKLFAQCRPDVALFGEKDYQQLLVVGRMAQDLDLAVRVVGHPTVREPDGLALSSRNRYLAPGERAAAPVLHRALAACARSIRGGARIGTMLAEGREVIERAGLAVEYFEARAADTLLPVHALSDGPVRLLVAARLGGTRLIDNCAV